MNEFLGKITPILFIVALIPWVFAGVYWYIANRDRFKHPEEYKDKGSSGERAIYLQLKQMGVKEAQILRNVYLPTTSGTTEIDLLIISRKGILVFECKNYGGNIYGDGNRKCWIQYLGHEKNKFLSPLYQNRIHVKHIKEFLKDENMPVIPFTVTIVRGNWKLRNIDPNDHFLTKGSFKNIYATLPDPEFSISQIKALIAKFKPYERPNAEIKATHIQNIQQKYHKK